MYGVCLVSPLILHSAKAVTLVYYLLVPPYLGLCLSPLRMNAQEEGVTISLFHSEFFCQSQC